MKGIIKSKKEIAKGTLFIELEESDRPDFKAGQFMIVALQNPPYIDEKGNRRFFSIVSSPNKKGVLSFATRLTNSGFKKSIQELPIGTEVEIKTIGGKFVLPEDQTKTLVFLAGGIGITPFMSMITYATEQKLLAPIILLYSNQDAKSSAFLQKLQDLEKQNPNFKLIATMTEDETWQGEKRRIDEQFVKDYVKDLNDSQFYIAGPPLMVNDLYQVLKKGGVVEEHIITENFSGY